MKQKKSSRGNYRIVFFLLFFILISFYPLFSGYKGDLPEARLYGTAGQERLDLLVELTGIYENKDLGKALAFGSEALKLMERSPALQKKRVKLMKKLCGIAYTHADYPLVLGYCDRMRKIAGNTGDKQLEAFALLFMGRAYKYQAKYNRAIEVLLNAVELYENAGNEGGKADCLNAIGLVYRRLNDYSKALEYILKASEIFDKLGAKSSLASTLNNSGLIHDTLGNTELALEHYKKGLKYDEELGNTTRASAQLGNIAEIYTRQGRYKEALEMLDEALNRAKRSGYKKRMSEIMYSMSLCYKRQKNYTRAMEFLNKSLSIKKEINEYYGIAIVNVEMGAIHRKLGNFNKARARLDQGLELAEKIKAPIIICEAYRELSALFESRGDFARALHYQKKFKDTNDSLFNKTNSRRIAELQARYDFERKDKEISLLKRDQLIKELDAKRERNLRNSLIVVTLLVGILAFVMYTRYRLKVRVTRALSKSEERLTELVEERTRDLKEAQEELVRKERLSVLGQLTATVAHEIRNPLGTVRSALFSIGKAVNNNNIERVKRALELSERNVIRCDKIIDDLLNFSRQRRMKREITVIDQWLTTIMDEIETRDDIERVTRPDSGAELEIDRERLRRAVVNVVENAVSAMQPGSPRGNRLTLTTGIIENHLEIKISDTGTGIPDDVQDKIFEPLFSTKQFGFGLGLPVVKNIMEEHNGGIEIESRQGMGTTVILLLPVKKVEPSLEQV